MRLRYDKNAKNELNDFLYTIKEFPFIFKENDVIEIGSGKGEMISQLALKNPNIRYIAIEKYPTVAKKIMQKIIQDDIKNLFILVANANELLEKTQGKVNTIWLTFSDPWPKKRHFKRRLTYTTFLKIYEKLLTKNGKLFFKTDNDKLFDFSIESLTKNDWNIEVLERDLHNSIYNENNIKTGYEIKWMQETNINFLIASKPNNKEK